MSRMISQYFISCGASWGNFSVNMATKVLKADSHWLKLWIFLEGWRGSRVNWGCLGELSVDLKDKEYFSVAGETESSAPKSMYSLAQIFLLSLGVTLLPRATAILANGFLLPGNGSGLDDVLGGVLSVRRETSSSTTASTPVGLSWHLSTCVWGIFSKARWTASVTAREIDEVKAFTSTVIKLAVLEFAAAKLVCSVSGAVSARSEGRIRLDCLRVGKLGCCRFLGGMTYQQRPLRLINSK